MNLLGFLSSKTVCTFSSETTSCHWVFRHLAWFYFNWENWCHYKMLSPGSQPLISLLQSIYVTHRFIMCGYLKVWTLLLKSTHHTSTGYVPLDLQQSAWLLPPIATSHHAASIFSSTYVWIVLLELSANIKDFSLSFTWSSLLPVS